MSTPIASASTPIATGGATDSAVSARPSEAGEDYVWRFALGSPDGPAGEEDPLLEMVRCFLRDFLSMGFLTSAGERVRVDGFALTNAPTEIHPIFLDAVAATGSSPGESPETKRDGDAVNRNPQPFGGDAR